jgi:hypothetical protein
MVYKGFWNHNCFQGKKKVLIGPVVMYALENKKPLVHLREGLLVASLGQYKRLVNGEGDTTVKCVSCILK